MPAAGNPADLDRPFPRSGDGTKEIQLPKHEDRELMRKFLIASCAAAFLAACQTTDGGTTFSQANKPTVVTSKNVAAARAASKAIFTRPTLGFKVAREADSRLLFDKTLPANVNDNNPLKDRTKGAPVSFLELTFQAEGGKTRVTGDYWLVLNPKEANKDVFNLLATPDGARLQNKLNELR
ncbi:hypothetical protein OA90_25750 [Labrenzia sp. OB1]|nr:hypothetical protein OA90_25750 [Labrenzia sp. OB1]